MDTFWTFGDPKDKFWINVARSIIWVRLQGKSEQERKDYLKRVKALIDSAV